VVAAGGMLDGPAYERWVAGYDVDTGRPKGRLRDDAHGLRFVEVVVNGPKTWSLAASLHPEIAAAYDAAQDRAAIAITPQRTVRDWRRRRVGPRWTRFQRVGRLYVTVGEARRFLASASITRVEVRSDG
jgi:exodeoxyribonuclease V alpha subunit